jgi:RHS repeat-associated protein
MVTFIKQTFSMKKTGELHLLCSTIFFKTGIKRNERHSKDMRTPLYPLGRSWKLTILFAVGFLVNAIIVQAQTPTVGMTGSTCVGGTAFFYFTGSCTPNWLPPGNGTITANNGNNINVLWTSAGNATVVASGSCGSASKNASISTSVTPTSSLALSTSNTCQGSPITFTASGTNGGTPFYNFYVDGASVQNGTSNTYSTSGLSAGSHTAYVIMTSSIPCVTQSSATSSTQNFTVTAKASYTVTLYGPSVICSTSPSAAMYVTVNNAVGNLSYVWSGAGGTTTTVPNYTFPSVSNGNTLVCTVYSDNSCVNQPVASNTYTVNITNSVTPSVQPQTYPLTYCAGATINLSAGGSNISGTPNYQWLVNGSQFQSSTSSTASLGPSYTNTPGSYTIAVNVTGISGNCLTSTSASGSSPSLTVNPLVTPTASLSLSTSNACQGSPITFTASGSNGGSPTYNFFIDGVSVQNSSSSTYSTSGLSVGSHSSYVIMTSSLTSCMTSTTATSTTQSFTVTAKASYSVTLNGPSVICSTNMSAPVHATVFNAVGNLTYQWSGAGGGNTTVPDYTFASVSNGNTLVCNVYSDYWCVNQPVASNTYTVNITNAVTPTAQPQVTFLTFCSGSTIGLSAPGNLSGNLTYSWKLNGNQFATTANTSLVASYTNVFGSYYPGSSITLDVAGISGTCLTSTSASGTVPALTINTPTVAGTLGSIPSSFCSSGSVTLSVTGNTGTITRYMVRTQDNGGSWTAWTSTTAAPSVTTTAGINRIYNFQAFVQNGTCVEVGTNVVSTTVYFSNSIGTLSVSTASACGATGSTTLSLTSLTTQNASWQYVYSDDGGVTYTPTWTTFSTVNGLSQAFAMSLSAESRKYKFQVTATNGTCTQVVSNLAYTTLSNPQPPLTQASTPGFCEWEPITVAATPSIGIAKWYSVSPASLLFTGNTYSPTNLNFGSYTYNVTNVDANNCESASTPYSLTINADCDNLMNWGENIVYTYNTTTDPTSIVARDSKVYSDGFGKAIQSQAKSITNNQVLASESIYDKLGNQTLTTLPAPINSSAFDYRYRFTTRYDPPTATMARYSWTDFDKPTVNNSSGEINNPVPVSNNGIGTLGWYYSSANTLEPNTPTSSFPYSRSYTPPGPNPTTSKSAGPGDAYRMGNNHEAISDRQFILPGELDHYYIIRNYFVSTPIPTANVTPVSTGPSFVPNTSVTTTANAPYLVVTCSASSGFTGLYTVNGSISVTPKMSYSYSVRGYTSTRPATLYVVDANNSSILWQGPAMPVGSANETTLFVHFTATSTTTAVKVGVFWSNPPSGDNLYISMSDFAGFDQVPTALGYKFISTDADKKQSATFVDADGRPVASALITSQPGATPITYDNWSYNYYNDLGQLMASVAPNGVIIGNNNVPNFTTTYKYDQLGRLIEASSPDEGTAQFVYSTDGKIRFSQNQEQRIASPHRFSYTNYDYFGRLVESGEYTSNGTNPFNFDPAYTPTTSFSPNSVLNIVDNNIPQGFDIETFTSTNFTGPSYKLDNVRCADYTFIKYDLQSQPSDLPSGDANHTQQNNLIGQVAKTQNANSTTWYSYDEFGNVEWTVQSINGFVAKTIDYSYDFLGNVTQVAYQNQSTAPGDRFFHHYTYNADFKLTDVATSFEGTAKTPQAKYKYYLHGPLKRVELATNLQGLDYVYTINGALKGINHADANKDPGNDGSNGFTGDKFGETLNYFSNDYNGAGYDAGTFTTTGGTAISDYYGGQIKSASWFTPIDNSTTNKKMYGYSYDNLNRFTNAQWGTVSGTSGSYTGTLSPTTYNESIGGYDKNGNILGLNRKDKNSTVMGNYSYSYNANKNQLASVVGGTSTVSYTYNAIGQMTQQVEGTKTMNVYYNAYGLTKEVRDGSNNVTEQYLYDDRGDLVKKLTLLSPAFGTGFKTTYYVRDASGNVLAIYEQNGASAPVALVEEPIYGAGRIGMMKPKSGQHNYFYEINDHLGNVRTVIGSPYTDNFKATMEPANAAVETKQFQNITPTAIPYGSANHTPGGSYVSRLNALQNGGVAPHVMGPGIILAVAPGDVISASVYAYYESSSGNGTNTLTAAATAAAIASAFTGGVFPGDPATIQNSFAQAYSPSGVFAGEIGSGSDNIPHAYLNMFMLDGNMLPDPSLATLSRAIPMTSASLMSPQPLSFSNVTITAPGYVFIYVDVNGNSPNYVYFDDLLVTQLHSPIVAGGDFYPFGLTMDDRQVKSERYRYGYQGQFAEMDSLTKLNNFELRLYEPRFGRWLSPDPYGQFYSPYIGMGNSPVNGVDPDGGDWFLNLITNKVEQFVGVDYAGPQFERLVGDEVTMLKELNFTLSLTDQISGHLADLFSSIFTNNPTVGIRFVGNGADQNVFGGRDYKPGMKVTEIRVDDMLEFMNGLKDLDKTPKFSQYDPNTLSKKNLSLKDRAYNIAQGIAKTDKAARAFKDLLEKHDKRVHGVFIQQVEGLPGRYYPDTTDLTPAQAKEGMWSDTVTYGTVRNMTPESQAFWTRKVVTLKPK